MTGNCPNKSRLTCRNPPGYEVDTFCAHPRRGVAAVAAFRPFAKAELEHPSHTVFAGFLRETLTPAHVRGLLACRSEVDDFCVKGREYYWLCRIKSHESKAWNSSQMRTLKLPSSSMRNLTTIRKLAALFPVEG